MRVLVAIAATALLLLGVAAPHHHQPGSAGEHECVACTVGAGLEARDSTPALAPPPAVRVAAATPPAHDPVTGAPVGAVPGQSPPAA